MSVLSLPCVVDACAACADDMPSCRDARCSVKIPEHQVAAHPLGSMLWDLHVHLANDSAVLAGRNCLLLLIASSLSSLETSDVTVHSMNLWKLIGITLEVAPSSLV